MAAVQKDDFLGEIRGKMPMYSNGLDASGEIIMCEKGVIVRNEGDTIKAPFSYIKMLEKAGDLPLGRVRAEMDIFDQMGQKHYFYFGFSEHHYVMLKKAIKGEATD